MRLKSKLTFTQVRLICVSATCVSDVDRTPPRTAKCQVSYVSPPVWSRQTLYLGASAIRLGIILGVMWSSNADRLHYAFISFSKKAHSHPKDMLHKMLCFKACALIFISTLSFSSLHVNAQLCIFAALDSPQGNVLRKFQLLFLCGRGNTQPLKQAAAQPELSSSPALSHLNAKTKIKMSPAGLGHLDSQDCFLTHTLPFQGKRFYRALFH